MEKVLNYEPLDKDIVSEIINSLDEGFRDYAFNKRTQEMVLQQCYQEKISVIYKVKYDEYGDLDYIEFIPVKFKRTPDAKRKNSPRLINLQIDMKLIESNKSEWEWKDESKYKQIGIKKNR